MNEEIKCKTHPDAPHGFVRNASHTEDRLVCECEYWEEPKVNERIKELADQAEEYAVRVTTGDWEDGLAYQDLFNQKFAELIVRECMDIARTVGNISEPDDWALDRCYEIEQRIQDRFGVEE